MRSASNLVTALALAIALVPASSGAQSGDGTGNGPPPLEESDSGIAGGSPLSSWHGTLQSLPYGPGLGSSYIMSAALTMPQVQTAIDALTALGYVRRADLDAGFSKESCSTAIVSFQFPGVDPHDRQPFVMVVTREDATRVYTQVMATAIATGPGGIPIHDESVPTACNLFVDRATDDGARLILEQESGPMNPVVWSTAYDLKSGSAWPSAQTQHFMSIASECWRSNMRELGNQMAIGAAWGAISHVRGGPGTMAWGAAIGVGVNFTHWVYNGGAPCP